MAPAPDPAIQASLLEDVQTREIGLARFVDLERFPIAICPSGHLYRTERRSAADPDRAIFPRDSKVMKEARSGRDAGPTPIPAWRESGTKVGRWRNDDDKGLADDRTSAGP
jgi:hypothetical protein